MVGSVVLYKGQYYLVWNINSSGKLQLIDQYGNKFPGTPNAENVSVVKHLPSVKYGNSRYMVDKYKRIFSLRTGKRVYDRGAERNKILNKLRMECV